MRSFSVVIPLLMLSLAACGGGDSGSENKSQPTPTKILSFSADATQVTTGGTVTLTWQTEGATAVRIEQTANGKTEQLEGEANGSLASKPISAETKLVLIALNGDAQIKSDPITVQVADVVVEFKASQLKVKKHTPVTLSWKVQGEGPFKVTLLAIKDKVLAEGEAKEGAHELELTETGEHRFRLRVEKGDTYNQTFTITLTALPYTSDPQIVAFDANPKTAPINKTVNLTWEVIDADAFWILNGDNPKPVLTGNVKRRSAQLKVTDEQTSFTLVAENDHGKVQKTVTVTGLPGAEITAFTVTPARFSTPKQEVVVTWETTEGTTDVSLRVGTEEVLSAGPRSGTYTFEATETVQVTLEAKNASDTNTRSLTVATDYDDAEPNNSLAEAIPIVGDGGEYRGKVLNGTDMDLYTLTLPAGARLWAQAGVRAGSCEMYGGTLELLNAAGEVVVTDARPDNTVCPTLHPLDTPAVRQLAAGTYYLRVSSSVAGFNSAYTLRARVTLPAPVPNVTITEGSSAPGWVLGDVVQILTNADQLAAAPQPYERTYFIKGSNVGLFLPLMDEGVESVPYTDSATTAMSLAYNSIGLANRASFTETELQDPKEAGFVIFQVLPKAGAPVGNTFNGSRPMLPNAIFPISIDLDLLKIEAGGSEVVIFADAATYPSFGSLPQIGANLDPPRAWGVDGDSRRGFLSYVTHDMLTANNRTAPGRYVWKFTVEDSTGARSELRVPFTVTP